MEALYHQTNSKLQEIEQSFQTLAKTLSEEENLKIENQIQMKITEANSNCNRLDVLLYKVPISQRQNAKMRVDQLKYDLRHLQNSLQMWTEKRKRQQEERTEREQLLSHRFPTNNATGNANETCLNLDSAMQHNVQLDSTSKSVDDMLFLGNSILGNLIYQRQTLKKAHKRILNIGSTLGLSNHTMKLIEQRLSEDKFVLIGGIFVTLLVIGLVLYFLVF